MRVALYGKTNAEAHPDVVGSLINTLQNKGAEVWVYAYLKDKLPPLPAGVGFFASHTDLVGVDFIISIGGDGTLLDCATVIRHTEIPVLGLNTGRLGFLTAFGKDETEAAAEALFSGRFNIEKRTLLQAETNGYDFDGHPYALNELTVHKRDTSSMVTVDVYLNDTFLNSYWADGLIISTPTGSTAYSLSCEGPILTPDSQNFIINPIAPHNLNVRPLVIPDSGTLRLKIASRSNDYLVSLDSRSKGLTANHEITVKKASFTINLVRQPGHDFLDTLRNKLFWGNDKRN